MKYSAINVGWNMIRVFPVGRSYIDLSHHFRFPSCNLIGSASKSENSVYKLKSLDYNVELARLLEIKSIVMT